MKIFADNLLPLLLTALLMVGAAGCEPKKSADVQNPPAPAKAPHEKISFMLGCGWGGVESKEVIQTRALVEDEDHATILSNLRARNPRLQVLSAIAAEQLAHSGKLVL